jgi:hypothetical protein
MARVLVRKAFTLLLKLEPAHWDSDDLVTLTFKQERKLPT